MNTAADPNRPKPQPFTLPCKDCGAALRRYRVTHCQSGPTTTWSPKAALYCLPCAKVRLAASRVRFAARAKAIREDPRRARFAEGGAA